MRDGAGRDWQTARGLHSASIVLMELQGFLRGSEGVQGGVAGCWDHWRGNGFLWRNWFPSARNIEFIKDFISLKGDVVSLI